MEKSSTVLWRRKFKNSILKAVEKEQIIEWMRAQSYLRLSDLQKYLKKQYDLVFDILQSSYLVVLIKIETKFEYNKIKSTRNYFELCLTV